MKAFLAIIAVGIAVFVVAGWPRPNTTLLQSLRSDSGKCQAMMAGYRASGIVQTERPNGGSTTLIVDDARWARIDQDTKVSVGLVAWCLNSGPDGRYSVYIRGARDGAAKGSVSDGGWLSP